jgi:hypothetical protein
MLWPIMAPAVNPKSIFAMAVDYWSMTMRHILEKLSRLCLTEHPMHVVKVEC